ncbi:MAG TPA: FAD-dependent oxidoreductase [Tepidisphaeraceae bacterium]|jgi:hypothetical protein|nr:FAD-dependent oxidoreductase [Tepidisphaeraceae bacterium]
MTSLTQLPNLRYFNPVPRLAAPPVIHVDVCVYGATAAGVVAAVAARRLGRTVALVAWDGHVGGLSSGGLGSTDYGKKDCIGGISREFYKRLGAYYEHPEGEAWAFEPKVAERIFRDMLDEADVQPRVDQHLVAVRKTGSRIDAIEMSDGTVYRASVFIDATYEGDLLAMAGVSYHVGREANTVYRETLNGIHFGHPNHNFRAFIDPYRVEGDPASGLIPLVQDAAPGEQGAGDACVQAYNFRMCLSDVPANRRPFPKPANYDAGRYELMRRYLAAGMWDVMWLTSRMPNGKTDTNNWGGIASDHIGANYRWPDGSYAEREAIFQDHVSYIAGLFYYLQNDESVPDHVRHEMGKWGLPLDEFEASGGFPSQLYVREARRMIGRTVVTEHHCRHMQKDTDAVGLATYMMDSHNCRRLVVGGRVLNEGNVEVPPEQPYSISVRAITPHAEQCSNLVVPVCLSASHIAFGSIRMEPVFMVLAQSSAHLAHLAIERRCDVVDVPYEQLQSELLAAGQVLQWPPAPTAPNNGKAKAMQTAGTH